MFILSFWICMAYKCHVAVSDQILETIYSHIKMEPQKQRMVWFGMDLKDHTLLTVSWNNELSLIPELVGESLCLICKKPDIFYTTEMFAKKGLSTAPPPKTWFPTTCHQVWCQPGSLPACQPFTPEAQTAAWNKDSKNDGENSVSVVWRGLSGGNQTFFFLGKG